MRYHELRKDNLVCLPKRQYSVLHCCWQVCVEYCSKCLSQWVGVIQCAVVLCSGYQQKHSCTVRISCCCRQKCKVVLVYNYHCCTALNIFTLEGIVNNLVEDMHTLRNYQCEKFESEKSASERHLLLQQLNSLHSILRVLNFFPLQF